MVEMYYLAHFKLNNYYNSNNLLLINILVHVS